jgi:hypothetical protein
MPAAGGAYPGGVWVRVRFTSRRMVAAGRAAEVLRLLRALRGCGRVADLLARRN